MKEEWRSDSSRRDIPMFERILVPLDGSYLAERALSVAARLARASQGSIVVVRAASSAPTRTGREAHLAQAQAYLNLMLTYPIVHDLPVERVAHIGPAASTILATVDAHAIDLVVICSHGYTGMARAIMGSIAQEVIHQAPIPILLLHAEGPLPIRTHADVHCPPRILVGLDGSAYAKQALLPAAALIVALAAPAQGALHLTRVIAPAAYQQTSQPHQSLDDAIQKADRSLRRTIENMRDGFEVPVVADLGLQFTWSVAVGDDVAETLIHVAAHGEGRKEAEGKTWCDLIALATHGHTGLQQWALGSVTERCPSCHQTATLDRATPKERYARPRTGPSRGQ
jgi:nucleotide-binding universal stress UspA family protein